MRWEATSPPIFILQFSPSSSLVQYIIWIQLTVMNLYTKYLAALLRIYGCKLKNSYCIVSNLEIHCLQTTWVNRISASKRKEEEEEETRLLLEWSRSKHFTSTISVHRLYPTCSRNRKIQESEIGARGEKNEMMGEIKGGCNGYRNNRQKGVKADRAQLSIRSNPAMYKYCRRDCMSLPAWD